MTRKPIHTQKCGAGGEARGGGSWGSSQRIIVKVTNKRKYAIIVWPELVQYLINNNNKKREAPKDVFKN